MKCRKCGSENVSIQMAGAKVKDVSIFRKLLRFMLILCTAGLWLLVPKKKGSIKNKKMAVCQNCGSSFSA